VILTESFDFHKTFRSGYTGPDTSFQERLCQFGNKALIFPFREVVSGAANFLYIALPPTHLKISGTTGT
jgi:hypothetical protein